VRACAVEVAILAVLLGALAGVVAVAAFGAPCLTSTIRCALAVEGASVSWCAAVAQESGQCG